MGGSNYVGYLLVLVMRHRSVAKLGIILAMVDARMDQRTWRNFARAPAIRPVNNNDRHKVRLLR